jgi:hypothetical protein
MTHNEIRTVNAITKKLTSLQTGLIISVYLFIRTILNERIDSGNINIRQLKEIAETPIITDPLRQEIKSWK